MKTDLDYMLDNMYNNIKQQGYNEALEKIKELELKIESAGKNAYYFGYESVDENPQELKAALREVCRKLGYKVE